jgi:1-acyl-sn-glycerol-3-phosphate acyltransferase
LELGSNPSELARPTLAAPELPLSGRAHIGFIRRSLRPNLLNRILRWAQRTLGQGWIHHCTSNLLELHGFDRLPEMSPEKSFVCVSNHRSFFDMYVVTAQLVRHGMKQRILFPVRANFFFDSWLGFFVNGVMSFFAMYPPLYRERKHAALNVKSLEEIAWLLRNGGVFVGLHPEGTRKKDDDPYTFLPPQRGVGKIIRQAGVEVIPVFVNGLINDLGRQVTSNFTRTGRHVNVVFGKPIDFEGLLDEPDGPRTHRAVADRVMAAIGELGREERAIRERQSSS